MAEKVMKHWNSKFSRMNDETVLFKYQNESLCVYNWIFQCFLWYFKATVLYLFVTLSIFGNGHLGNLKNNIHLFVQFWITQIRLNKYAVFRFRLTFYTIFMCLASITVYVNSNEILKLLVDCRVILPFIPLGFSSWLSSKAFPLGLLSHL